MRISRKFALGFCLPLAFLGGVGLAGATESPDEIIASCREADDATARIACLESALRSVATGAVLPETEPAVSAPNSSPPQAEASDRNPSGVEIVAGRAANPGNDDQLDIGREQVEARNMTREQQLAQLESARDLKVAAYSEVPYRRIVVRLENGQVWRQIAGDNQYFRVNLGRNQTVDISETPLGGYQLRFNQLRRTIRVERIE